jgi:two-component system alkaline phosphatase synthesis response regulator PhoP
MAKILVIEDEESVQVAIQDRLLSEGHRVESAADGICGLEKARGSFFDAIILDLMLPGKSGLDVCRDLRESGNHTPVLMLTARGQLLDKVLGLKLGADDYLTKPFEMLELLARLEALLRREQRSFQKTVGCRLGDVEIDFRSAEVKRNGKLLEISSKELKLLHYFVEHKGIVLSRNQLLDEVWGYDAMPTTRTVDVHVSSLRQLIEPDPAHPRFIITVHRRGYKFTRDD